MGGREPGSSMGGLDALVRAAMDRSSESSSAVLDAMRLGVDEVRYDAMRHVLRDLI